MNTDTKQGNHRTFVGFGFGPIQAGLFLYEAHKTGLFQRLVVAEVIPEVAEQVNRAGGYSVNIATSNGVITEFIPRLEVHNPASATGRAALVDAIAQATDIATALPSVDFFERGGAAAPAGILADGLRLKVKTQLPPAVIFAGENNIHAAELLTAAIRNHLDPATAAQTCECVNTVIGKMSQVVSNPLEIRERHLAPSTPDSGKAFLVEAFNHILISPIHLAGYQPAIPCFAQKADLSLFEETKLYGHNAVHAMAGYLLQARGCMKMADLRQHPDLMAAVMEALVAETGAALCRKYAGTDTLATPEGFKRYADDLLNRMINPWLGDTVDRVIRDPARKLGWSDRLVGSIRLCLSQGIHPRRLAEGTVHALRFLAAERRDSDLFSVLESVWGANGEGTRERSAVITLLKEHVR